MRGGGGGLKGGYRCLQENNERSNKNNESRVFGGVWCCFGQKKRMKMAQTKGCTTAMLSLCGRKAMMIW